MKRLPALPQERKILHIRQDFPIQVKVRLNKLAVHSKSSIRFIDFDDILYCKADSNYTEIHLQSGEMVVSSSCLKTVESKITSELFLRIHASYLVNLSRMTALSKSNAWQITIGSTQLPISRSRFEKLKMYLDL